MPFNERVFPVIIPEVFKEYPRIIVVTGSPHKREQMQKISPEIGVMKLNPAINERDLEAVWAPKLERLFGEVADIGTHNVAMAKAMAMAAQLSMSDFFLNEYGHLSGGEYIIVALDSEIAHINPHDQKIATIGKPDNFDAAKRQIENFNRFTHTIDAASIAILKVRVQAGLPPQILNGLLTSVIHEADLHSLGKKTIDLILDSFGTKSDYNPQKYAGGVVSKIAMDRRYHHSQEVIVHGAKGTGSPFDIYPLGFNNDKNDEMALRLYQAIFGNHPLHRRFIEEIINNKHSAISLHPQAIQALNSYMLEMQKWILNKLVGDDVSPKTTELQVLANGQIVRK